jgi:hypothetical protein
MFQHTLRSCVAAASVLALAACDRPDTPTDAQASVASATQLASAKAEATQLVELRQVTARFENFDKAYAAGYQTQITPCWEHATHGAMGYHWGKTALIDANVALLEPELIMYEPQAGGHLRLVGFEYIVPLAAWEEAGHDLSDPNEVPQLLGQKFTQHSFLPIFKLHIWLWRNNPAGTFADWNPKVSCASAEETEIFQ